LFCLIELLEEEKTWLDKVQNKVSQSRIGADAEELSEELDVIFSNFFFFFWDPYDFNFFYFFFKTLERILKAHSSQYKERIIEICTLLTEKRVLIPLISHEARDYQVRVQRVVEDANNKIQNLDNAINDVQNWEKRLYELKEWIVYMDKYLVTRVDQDIFADDVPEDAARIQEEFTKHELIIKELDDAIYHYKQQDKTNAAYRLEQQLNLLRKNWIELNFKMKKFQKPSDFDVKLQKMKRSIDEIDAALHKIDIYNEDPDVIHLQFEQCMVNIFVKNMFKLILNFFFFFPEIL
jgi:hypothetical protein